MLLSLDILLQKAPFPGLCWRLTRLSVLGIAMREKEKKSSEGLKVKTRNIW